MAKKIKGLWIGDAVVSTGFARVNHSVIESLPKYKYDIHHLGINYFGDPHPFKHKIYPAAIGTQGDLYGLNRVVDLIRHVSPDFIFILNDPWMIDVYLEKIKEAKLGGIPIVAYFPVDAEEHSAAYYRHFDIVDAVCIYTKFGMRVLLQAGAPYVTPDKMHVIPHGIDTRLFFPIDKEQARSSVYPQNRLEEFMNSFIILNANRNQPRKRIDITMWAFREFQKNKADVKLYLHMGITDMVINIIEKSAQYGFDNKLVVSAMTPYIPGVPDTRMNEIYNATDVGINTSLGEGWGLTNWEHAATGKPQILPNNSVHNEVWGDNVILVDTIMPQMIDRVNTVGQVVSIDGMVRAFEWAYIDWKNGGSALQELGNKALARVTEEQFSWEEVGKKFHKVFQSVIK